MSAEELGQGPTWEHAYLRLASDVINHGHEKGDRTGTGTRSLHGACMAFDLTDFKIPVLTTKEVFHGSPIKELVAFFIAGETDVRPLKALGLSFWDDWVIPTTARWEPVPEGKLQSGQDMLTWLRCYDPNTYQYWKAYKEDHQIGQPIRADVLPFLEKHGHQPTNQRLVSGSIGEGAYGTAWRNWEDTRAVLSKDAMEYYKRGYKFVCDVPNAANFGQGSPANAAADHPSHRSFHYTIVHRRIDQLANAIELLRTNPDSRRIIVSAWNPGKIEDAVLPPCHSFYQFLSRKLKLEERAQLYGGMLPPEDTNHAYFDKIGVPARALTLLLDCRSQDLLVGTAFNILQYSVLAHMVAQVTGHVAEQLVWFGGDVHVYNNQIELAREHITRRPVLAPTFLKLNPDVKEIDDFKVEDFEVLGYDVYHPRINYPVAV